MKTVKRTTLATLLGMAIGISLAGPALAVISAPTDTVKGHAPTMTPGSIKSNDPNGTGVIAPGDVLTIDTPFVFNDADGDIEQGTTYSWQADGTEVGTGTTYTVQAADAGKNFSLLVTPRTDSAITDPYEGAPVESSNTLSVEADGEVIRVTITGMDVDGRPLVGQTLTADATCSVSTCAAAGSNPGELTYKWQIETSVGSGIYQDISGAANTATYTPEGGDQKRQIRVNVSRNP